MDTINSERTEQKEVMKRTIKDSVFTDLFQNKKYLLQLYKSLHPEDDVTEDDLTDVTIKNVLTDNIYNDLGFVVEDHCLSYPYLFYPFLSPSLQTHHSENFFMCL